jgi:DNA-binding MarR family transcriptional regulator
MLTRTLRHFESARLIERRSSESGRRVVRDSLPNRAEDSFDH